jgi:hypothetical protein
VFWICSNETRRAAENPVPACRTPFVGGIASGLTHLSKLTPKASTRSVCQDGVVGYELHITRAFMSFDSERYPILGAEVDDLVRDEPDLTIPPDAPRRPDLRYIDWGAASPHGDFCLLLRAGRLSCARPGPERVRRMTELAARLDAWVIGDDGEVYEWDGIRIVDRQRDPEAFAWHRRCAGWRPLRCRWEPRSWTTRTGPSEPGRCLVRRVVPAWRTVAILAGREARRIGP